MMWIILRFLIHWYAFCMVITLIGIGFIPWFRKWSDRLGEQYMQIVWATM